MIKIVVVETNVSNIVPGARTKMYDDLQFPGVELVRIFTAKIPQGNRNLKTVSYDDLPHELIRERGDLYILPDFHEIGFLNANIGNITLRELINRPKFVNRTLIASNQDTYTSLAKQDSIPTIPKSESLSQEVLKYLAKNGIRRPADYVPGLERASGTSNDDLVFMLTAGGISFGMSRHNEIDNKSFRYSAVVVEQDQLERAQELIYTMPGKHDLEYRAEFLVLDTFDRSKLCGPIMFRDSRLVEITKIIGEPSPEKYDIFLGSTWPSNERKGLKFGSVGLEEIQDKIINVDYQVSEDRRSAGYYEKHVIEISETDFQQHLSMLSLRNGFYYYAVDSQEPLNGVYFMSEGNLVGRIQFQIIY